VETFYEATADPQLRFAALTGQAEEDRVIVGGGFAGLATALSLLEHGVRDCRLLEAQTIGHGASGRNGGFVSGGFSLDASDLLDHLGREEARRLYRLSEDAVGRIRDRIDRYAIQCDPVYAGVIVANWFADDGRLRKLQRFMRESFDLDWHWLARDETRALLRTERYHSALHQREAFHFHPLRYAQGKARVLRDAGVRLHENSRVTAIVRDGAGWRVETADAAVRCREVIVCCGGYIGDLCAPLARAALPVATYVMATEPLGDRLATAIRTEAAVFDTRFAFDYYRPLRDTRLLWGGRMSIREPGPEAVERLLSADLLRVYPQLRGVRVTQAWSGLMGYSRHKMPQIGRLPSGIWYAMGFGGHGVATTTMAGEVLTQALLGEAAIPAALSSFGLPRTFGLFGKAAAQANYWRLQTLDALRDVRPAERPGPH
jgi:glycine/D-amino acid oxidase-like deaminating enzyme